MHVRFFVEMAGCRLQSLSVPWRTELITVSSLLVSLFRATVGVRVRLRIVWYMDEQAN